jgi:lipoprotein-anchoring transpeptidase ErfK/SrfK
MYYYKDGEKVFDCDVVTGNLTRGNGSPDGIFKIVYKQKDATLVGENYESAVSYFMPFAYNIRFHDASWRNEFGGTIYKTSGSHGCVNMPSDKAQELFSMVETGTPVVCYYREAVQLTNNACKLSNAYSYVATESNE